MAYNWVDGPKTPSEIIPSGGLHSPDQVNCYDYSGRIEGAAIGEATEYLMFTASWNGIDVPADRAKSGLYDYGNA